MITCLIALGSLTACRNEHEGKGSTQVAAKVGNYEITLLQINSAAHLDAVPKEQLPAARAQVLRGLVDEQLLIAQAEELKLDRSPNVIEAVDQARRQIIARAYVDHLIQQQQKPTESDIHTYYQEHPDLFSRRRIYTVKELTVPDSQVNQAALVELADSSRSMEQLAQALNDRGIAFKAGAGERRPESLPIDLVPRIAQAKDGSINATKVDGAFYALQVISSRPAPLTEPESAPSIQRFLEVQRSRDVAMKELERLRAKGTVEYFGDFSSTTAHAPAPSLPLPPVNAGTQPAANRLDPDTIKSGMQGVK